MLCLPHKSTQDIVSCQQKNRIHSKESQQLLALKWNQMESFDLHQSLLSLHSVSSAHRQVVAHEHHLPVRL
jgi:hypothetical protein